MRLWHYKMIPFLPEAQLLGQWRECCAVAQMWANKHDIRHALVKPVIHYPPEELLLYSRLVANEMEARGYHLGEYTVAKLKDNIFKCICEFDNDYKYIRYNIDDIWKGNDWNERLAEDILFRNWHNQTYFHICYWNLYEKYLCGCVPDIEWSRFEEGGKELI